MATDCCEYTGPPLIGDAAAVITIYSGSGGDVSGVDICAEGCDNGTNNCAYDDVYRDVYCDATEGGTYPNARVSDFCFTINDMPADSILTIDAAEQTVTLTDETGNTHESQLEVMDWHGLFEWITAAGNGCQRICIDTSGATTNAGTHWTISSYDREL